MRLTVRDERWPIAGAFTISRGSKTEAHVVIVEIEHGGHRGRGECTPYPRYGATVEGVMAAITAVWSAIEASDRMGLQSILPPGAARNAVDCAFWDLEAKTAGQPVWRLAGLPEPRPVTTCFTISLGSPEKMAQDARAAAARPLLKLKIGGPDDLARLEAVRAAAPASQLVVDANEGLTFDDLKRLAPEFKRLGVVLIEQPLKAGADEALEGYKCPVPLCADESLHLPSDLAACIPRYDAVNIKLDKTGGLTEALALSARARAAELDVMAGCMVATSLAMAPAMLIAQVAAFTDLDGPLLLARDREPGLRYEGSQVYPPEAGLWG